MSITEIEQAITQLSPQDFKQLREWFEELEAQKWDEQIEADAKSGRLDQLLGKADEEINDLSVIEERRNEPGRPLREYLQKSK